MSEQCEQRTQSINFVARYILLCFNSFALAPKHCLALSLSLSLSFTLNSGTRLLFLWLGLLHGLWCGWLGVGCGVTAATGHTRLRICNNVAKVSVSLWHEWGGIMWHQAWLICTCSTALENVLTINHEVPRGSERQTWRMPSLFFSTLTNLVFDFCISVFDIFCSSSNWNSSIKMAKDLSTLGWDYFMFVAFIALTVLGPLWTRIFGKTKQRSKADYVFATGGVSIVAVMISIARGTLGVRSVLGKFPLSLSFSISLSYFLTTFHHCRLSQWTLLSRLSHVGNCVRHDERLSHCLLHVCAGLLQSGHHLSLSVHRSKVSASSNVKNPLNEHEYKNEERETTTFN